MTVWNKELKVTISENVEPLTEINTQWNISTGWLTEEILIKMILIGHQRYGFSISNVIWILLIFFFFWKNNRCWRYIAYICLQSSCNIVIYATRTLWIDISQNKVYYAVYRLVKRCHHILCTDWTLCRNTVVWLLCIVHRVTATFYWSQHRTQRIFVIFLKFTVLSKLESTIPIRITTAQGSEQRKGLLYSLLNLKYDRSEKVIKIRSALLFLLFIIFDVHFSSS